MPFLSGCENTDMQLATDAGIDAVKAMTPSDKDMQEIASQSAQYSDKKHTLALPENKYVKQAKVSREIVDELTGHIIEGESFGRYGKIYSISILFAAVKKVNYNVDLNHLTKNGDRL